MSVIKDVSLIRVVNSGYLVKCPHCGATFEIEHGSETETRGAQFQHKSLITDNGCNGWIEITDNAVFRRQK